MRRSTVTLATVFMGLVACQSGGEARNESTGSTAEAHTRSRSKWTTEDDALLAPVWKGNDDKGSLYVPLWRGVASAIEDYVPAPQDHDCSRMKGTVRVEWDKQANSVHFTLKFRGLIPHPEVHRTEGVDWTFNKFHQTPKDFTNAGYRFWTLFGRVNTGHRPTFYYDPQTLQLLGSEYDFPNGPPNGGQVIPVEFPIFPIIPSLIFPAAEDGSAFHEWTTPYDHVTAEGGAVSFSPNSFVPLDLCQAAPLQPDISQLRPYIADWRPPSEGPSWSEILHAGVLFDTTIDPFDADGPGGVFPYPYVYSDVSLMSNAPVTQGGIPNNFLLKIPAVIQNVAPVIRPVPFGNGKSCNGYYNDPHVSAPRYCEQQH